jgi:transcriptional regulator with XRE-family HTH domain
VEYYEDTNDIFIDKECKLKYVIKKLKLEVKEIAKKLQVGSSFISKLLNPGTKKLRQVHLYAFCNAYNVPMNIFEDANIKTAEQIDELLEKNQEDKTLSMFQNNEELLNQLVGTWYFYSYTSNTNLIELWETETYFESDYSVKDEHDNQGSLYIGKNQSIILKESNGAKNITSITFDNSGVFYDIFLFSRVSKANVVNNEMFNFGVCSRNQLDKEVVKKILGDMKHVQLQIDYDVLRRLSEYINTGKN